MAYLTLGAEPSSCPYLLTLSKAVRDDRFQCNFHRIPHRFCGLLDFVALLIAVVQYHHR